MNGTEDGPSITNEVQSDDGVNPDEAGTLKGREILFLALYMCNPPLDEEMVLLELVVAEQSEH